MRDASEYFAILAAAHDRDLSDNGALGGESSCTPPKVAMEDRRPLKYPRSLPVLGSVTLLMLAATFAAILASDERIAGNHLPAGLFLVALLNVLAVWVARDIWSDILTPNIRLPKPLDLLLLAVGPVAILALVYCAIGFWSSVVASLFFAIWVIQYFGNGFQTVTDDPQTGALPAIKPYRPESALIPNPAFACDKSTHV